MSLLSRLFRAASPTKTAAKSTSVAPPAANPATGERALRITRIVRETPDAATLTLAAVDGRPLIHQAGQYLSLRFVLPTGPLWRAYSICTPPGSAEVSVTVKRVAGGRVSSHVVESTREGDELIARGPQGNFLVPATAKRLFFIAGGSGITPIMSQLQSALAGSDTPLTLLYGNRSEEDIIFRARLEALVAAHPRLCVRHVLSQPRDAQGGAAPGILDQPTVAAQLRELAARPEDFDAFMLCGPEPMMQAARQALLAHGVPDPKIHEERFTTASTRSELPAQANELRFVHQGSAELVTVEAGETLLETTQRLNLPLDFSCMAGQCGTCLIQLDAGDVEMEEPNCLTEVQRKRGLVLACVSRPLGACSVSTLPPSR